jgi:SHS family lactate transporter-like MFS transporter
VEKYIYATLASFSSWAGNIYDLLVITYVYEYLSKYLGMNTAEGTLLFALGLIFRVIGGYIFGKYADSHGRKAVLIMGTAGYSLAQAGIAFSPSIIVVLAFRSIQGLMMGAQWTAGTVIAYENAPLNLRSLINGVVQAGYGVGYAMTGISFLVFSPHMAGLGWRLFLLTGSVPLIVIPLILSKVSDVKTFSKKAETKVNVKEYIGVLIRASLVISGMFFSYYSVFAVYPDFVESLGISKSLVGEIMFASNMALAVSFIVFGRVADYISKRKLIIIGVVGEMIGIPMMLPLIHFLQTFSFMVIGLVLYTVSTGFWPLAPLLVIESVPVEVRSALTGLSYNLGSVMGGVGSIVMGTLVTLFGIGSASLWGNVLCYTALTVVLATLLTWNKGGNKIRI